MPVSIDYTWMSKNNKQDDKIRIVHLEDHPIFSEGLSSALFGLKKFKIIRIFDTAQIALKILPSLDFEILIADLVLPDMSGIDMIKALIKKCPHTKVIILSSYCDEATYKEARFLGVSGFLNKTSSTKEIRDCISVVAKGGFYENLEKKQANLSRSEKTNKDLQHLQEILTDRELEILKYISKGQNSISIAHALNLSERTIDKHRENIRKKLDLKGTNSLLIFALKHKSVLLASFSK